MNFVFSQIKKLKEKFRVVHQQLILQQSKPDIKTGESDTK